VAAQLVACRVVLSFSALKTEATRCSETYVFTRPVQRYIPEVTAVETSNPTLVFPIKIYSYHFLPKNLCYFIDMCSSSSSSVPYVIIIRHQFSTLVEIICKLENVYT
jgi:hypothetical protein